MAEKSLIKIQQENLELTKENSALKETVTKLLTELDQSRNIVRLPEAERILLSPEQRIIEDQICLLEAVSMTRPLSLDETRTLDLLIKNKRLLEKEKPLEPPYRKVPENEPTDSDLLRLAGNVEPETVTKRIKSKAGTKDPVA